MVMTLQPTANAPQPHRVLRALWFDGEVRAPGSILNLPRQLGIELRHAGKVERAADDAAAVPASAKKAKAD